MYKPTPFVQLHTIRLCSRLKNKSKNKTKHPEFSTITDEMFAQDPTGNVLFMLMYSLRNL